MPSIEYFAHWQHHGHMVIEAFEHYQKRSWRNKTAIVGPDKPLLLSVPLKKGKNNNKMIREVQISYDEPWHRVHLASIKSAYGKTAFFEEMEDDLSQILLQKHDLLWDLNFTLIRFFTQLLHGTWTYSMTEDYLPNMEPALVDLRGGVPAGVSSAPGIPMPAYAQVHRLNKTFLPNLSILDLLCHLGPGTEDYLDQLAKKLYA